MTAPMRLRTRSRRPQSDRGFDIGDTGAQIARFQDAGKAGVEAYTADARDQLTRDVGMRLGGLASMGALRSGGVATGVRDATREFGTQVGRQAAQTSLQSAALGADAAARGRDFNLSSSVAQFRAGQDERDFAERKRQFDLELEERRAGRTDEYGFRREELGQRGQQFGEDLGFRREALGTEYGFKERELGQRGNEFSQELGFRREGLAVDRQRVTNEQRRFEQERADAQEAARQKKKGGLFGFIGKAIGVAADFIPGGGTIKKGLQAVGKVAG